jgi:outer membrane immunogenic protein
MRHLLTAAALASLAGASLLSGPALASDLPSNKAPPPPVFTAVPIAFSWTGFYGGIEGGGEFARTRGDLNVAAAGATPYSTRTNSGLLGGVVGYNHQIGALVLGVEANGDGILGGQRTTLVNNAFNVKTSSSYDADVRARVGFAIDRAMFFAAGGVAFGNVNTAYSGATLAAPATFDSQRVGWTAGGGVDYAFTNNIIGRAEYRFTDLGSSSFTNAASGVVDKTKNQSNAALLGIMYKFGNP